VAHNRPTVGTLGGTVDTLGRAVDTRGSTAATLGGIVSSLDAARFVGRAAELKRLGELLDDGTARVVFVHGPAGVGKSALLRELDRRARAHGLGVYWVEGRELSPGPDALSDALAAAREHPRPLILIDTFERIQSVGGHLRQTLLPTLPATARVVIASRRPPGRAWHERGWDSVVAELRLDGLAVDEALELLSRHGITALKAEQLAAWARGSPLALTLAAQAPRADRSAAGEPTSPEVIAALAARLIDSELDPRHARALWVAAIARVTTPELLRDALPGSDADAELGWLVSRTFAEPLGEGIALHELVADALRRNLDLRDPVLERELRRRICDHFYERARRGDLLMAIDLSHLSRSPAIRWGFSWQPASRLRLDELRSGDADRIRAALRGTWHERLLPGTERFIEHGPEHITTVRDGRDRLVGYTIALTPPDAPPFCDDDPLLGPRLVHARRLKTPERAVLWRDVVDLTARGDSDVVSMLGMAGILRAAHSNPRWAYLPINRHLPGALEFSRALGARRIQALDASVGRVRLECHLVDYGPGGLLGAQRDLIYRELGLAPGAVADDHAQLAAAVRAALRNLQRPDALARSELASGATLEERAASVRALLMEAAERAFGQSAGDQLTRRALMAGYLEPQPSHELAAELLSLSRSAYFRRLRRATERLAGYIATKRAPG